MSTPPTSATTDRVSRSRWPSTSTPSTGPAVGLAALRSAFDADHQRLFSFVLDAEHELVTVRATAHGPRPQVAAPELEHGDADPSPALRAHHRIWVDGAEVDAGIYDRALLRAGNVVPGPAIITEMDSTTLVLPGHTATVHPSGSLLIRPVDTHRGELTMARLIETATGPLRSRGRRRGHHRPDRERAAQRPLRDGRGALPDRAVAGHPRTARRVPADRQPATGK